MKTFTIFWRNEMTGRNGFRGTFETQELAADYVNKEINSARSFATFEIWTGSAGNGIKPIAGTLVRGKR